MGIYDNLLMSYFGIKTFENIDYTRTPVFIGDLSGEENILTIRKNENLSGGSPTVTVEYSYDNNTWVSAGSTTTEGIHITIPANGRVFLRSNAVKWGAFVDGYVCSNGISAEGNFIVAGNLLSLMYGSNFTGNETTLRTTDMGAFVNLFSWARTLVSAKNLVINAIGKFSHQGLFYDCRSLTEAPQLPVTNLDDGCYYDMFWGCTSLEKAPTLPAITLKSQCYERMFYNCSLLNYIECLATDISANHCTDNWLDNVSVTGTFIKNANMSSWTTGTGGIPSGWTVQNA